MFSSPRLRNGAMVVFLSAGWLLMVVDLSNVWLSKDGQNTVAQAADARHLAVSLLYTFWVLSLILTVDSVRSAIKRRYLVAIFKFMAASKLLALLEVPASYRLVVIDIGLAIGLALVAIGLDMFGKEAGF